MISIVSDEALDQKNTEINGAIPLVSMCFGISLLRELPTKLIWRLSRSELKLGASWDLCCDSCGMKWKAKEWTTWLFFKTKAGDTKQNSGLGAAHVLQNCKLMPLCLLPLWVSMARNKPWAHKEQTTFQERPGFGSSTRKRNCKAQPLPHPTHASYKQGIRKIPFICAHSFPALGFSDLSFIWLINLFYGSVLFSWKGLLIPASDLLWKSEPQGRWEWEGIWQKGECCAEQKFMEQCFPIISNVLDIILPLVLPTSTPSPWWSPFFPLFFFK